MWRLVFFYGFLYFEIFNEIGCDFMGIMEIENFNSKYIIKRLMRFGKDGRDMVSIVKFVFDVGLESLFEHINGKFSSNLGRRAYPREMLMIVLLYAYYEGKREYVEIEKSILLNKIYSIVTFNKVISAKTFERFMDNLDLNAVETIFELVLKIAEEYDFLDTAIINMDGTIGLTSGSKYYKIYPDELETLILAKKHGILLKSHKNKEESLKILEKKIKYHQNSPEIVEILEKMCLKPQLFTTYISTKIKLFKKEFDNHEGLKFLFVNNPEARLMKTKNGNFDACLNPQITVNNNYIITSAMVSQKTTDNQLFPDTTEDFIKTLMAVEKYESVLELLENTIFNSDNGYFSNMALEYIFNNNINAILDTRLKIIEENEDYLLNADQIKKLGRLNLKKNLKYKPSKNQYYCFKNKPFTLTNVKTAKNKLNEIYNIPEDFLIKNWEYTNWACVDCEYKDACAKGGDYRTITDTISTLNQTMRQIRHTPLGNHIYQYRWKTVETIFAYFKGKDGILRFLSKNLINTQKEIKLMSIAYNLKRITNLKGTAYL
jgi:hypothetical protein